MKNNLENQITDQQLDDLPVCRLCGHPILPEQSVVQASIPGKPIEDVHQVCVHRRIGLADEPGFSIQNL